MMQERVAMVISKPPMMRSTPEIDVVLPWLRKRSDLLQDLEKGTSKKRERKKENIIMM